MGKGEGDTSCKAMVSPGIVLDTPRHGAVEVIPGVIDDTARFAFTSGHCHALALAIHQHTGWPMLAMSGRFSAYRDLRHVVVQMPDGRWLDINGPQEPEERLVIRPISEDEVTHMGRIRDWDNPDVEPARSFVEPLLKEHGLL